MMFVITVKEKVIGRINVKMIKRKEDVAEAKKEEEDQAVVTQEEIKKEKGLIVLVSEVVVVANQDHNLVKAVQSKYFKG